MKDCFEMSPSCLTGVYPHPLGDYPLRNAGMPSPQMNWQYPATLYQSKAISPSERRDSGIHSSSDGHVSSPGSDDSERYVANNAPYSPKSRYAYQINPYQNQNDMKSPSTPPPSYPIKPKEEPIGSEDERPDLIIPNPEYPSNDTNALKRLQMSVEKNLTISSPEPSEHRTSENNNEEYTHAEDYSVPTVNSHGKVKTVKCKQCQIVFNTKLEFWTHQREHIKPDRLLKCEKCPFVTEYKHHLEYHMRNHGGEKPFQCKECDYKCVNKSMLNSHMKSHSNIYQYRCASCHYSSKYCHSLKLHLRKYNHKPAMVLNPDGTPNPLPIIDVYGTRRGPKLKNGNGEEEVRVPSPKRPRTETSMAPMHPLPPVIPGMMPLPMMSQDPDMHLKLMFQQALLMHTYQNLHMMSTGLVNPQSSVPDESSNNSTQQESSRNEEDSVLDLSKASSTEPSEKSNFKLDTPSTTDDDEFEDESLSLLYKVKVEHDVDDSPSEELKPATPPTGTSTPTSTAETLRCPHCCITFDDIALYTIHMRFHNFTDPFTCNSCGQKCENKIEFTVHIFSRPH